MKLKEGKAIDGKLECPQPIGYFTILGDGGRTVKYPAPCKRWDCPVCGPRKLRRFLYQINEAARALMKAGYRFRGLTLTLGPRARNQDIGKYWHRFVMSLKKAGYRFDYLWVKEFQKNGKLHLHALITAFIPWNVIKYYWTLATEGTSNIVWIAKAAVTFTAAYIAKYLTKYILTAPFRKGERRYSMSKGIRAAWPKLERTDDGIQYDFTYRPDDSRLLEVTYQELWGSITKHNKSNIVKSSGLNNIIYL